MAGDGIIIRLDSPTNSYYAGTNVTGEVIVNTQKALDIRSLILKIKGEAIVHWDEEKNENRQSQDGTTRQETTRVNYFSEEEYFSNKYNLLGETEIPAGQQTYRFSSPLPPLLPSSFSGEYGSVKYTIKATIDRPWKFDQEAKLEFKVVAPLDLNYNPVAKEPARQEKVKTFCCWCCASGPCVVTLSVPQKGYVPTQPIPINLDVENGSNVSISEFQVVVNKTIKWICQRPERCEKETTTEIAKVTLEGCPQRVTKNMTHNLNLPDMPVTNVDACSVIKITHQLRVEGMTEGCHNNPTVKIPLIIGTVPIAGTYSYSGGDPAQFQPPAYSPVQQSSNPDVQGLPGQPGYPVGPSYPSAPIQPGYPSVPAQQAFPSVPAVPAYPSGPDSYPSAPPSAPSESAPYPAAPAQPAYTPAVSTPPAYNPAYSPQTPYPPAPAPDSDSPASPLLKIPNIGFKM